MLLKSELQDWLNHPTTKLFQQALEAEAKADKEDLLSELDQNDLSRDDLYITVNINKAVRDTYSQFSGPEAGEKIMNMFDYHGLILKEEESEDDSN